MSESPCDQTVTLNGLSFHYRDWGGVGQPIVLLHGLASTSHIWDMVAPILVNNYRVVALDQRGHGESDTPDHGYDFPTVVSDMYAFIHSLDFNKPLVFGHSWGGDVALEYAVAHQGEVKGLGFVDGGTINIAGRPGNTLEQAMIDMAPPMWEGMTFDKLEERAKTWRPPSMLSPQHIEILRSNFRQQDDDTITSRLSRANHLRIIEALWNHSPPDLYKQLICPVLLMPARQKDSDSVADRRTRKEASIAEASKLIPNSMTVWMEDSVHDVPIQRPELVAGVITEHIENGFFD
jgi:pimeloyl-ACP methyl ester carboxylesterase